jgi:hypothetical protein
VNERELSFPRVKAKLESSIIQDIISLNVMLVFRAIGVVLYMGNHVFLNSIDSLSTTHTSVIILVAPDYVELLSKQAYTARHA